MRNSPIIITLVALTFAGCTAPQVSESPAPTAAVPASAPPTPAALAVHIPVEYFKLGNGLRVVLSEDHQVPIATVAVYYNIGFRVEPRDRTGFAHLFEHMMFQGSKNLPKFAFDRLIQGNGGVLNGSTRLDFTNYFEVVPAHTLETVLWAEADRMGGLNISQENLDNQIGVVSNEVKVNVLNQPYGGFPWLDVPSVANKNWYNAHNFYGELDHIQAAKLDEVHAFFNTYYSPNNAVLVVAGDFDPAQTRQWIERYFGRISSRPLPPPADISEPKQTEERRGSRVDSLAPRPALAVAYHVPERWTPEWYAFGVIDELLLQGEDSVLYRQLVKERGYSDGVGGGINLLGNAFNYKGPMLWMAYLVHDPQHTAHEIVADMEATFQRLQNEPVATADFERALTTFRSELYDVLGSPTRTDLVDLLACLALFDDDPARINNLEAGFRAVTPQLIQKTAREYLVPGNRTVYTIQPGESGQPAAGGGQ
jgi:predicted Zn-dependent peptidase